MTGFHRATIARHPSILGSPIITHHDKTCHVFIQFLAFSCLCLYTDIIPRGGDPMPPYVSAECTNPKCNHKNRYDLAELKKDQGVLHKGTIYRAIETDEELVVTCEKCGQRFKITVPRTDAKRGGYRSAEID
jgi:RNase P subunit RPR2